MPSLIGRCGGGGVTRWAGVYDDSSAVPIVGGGAFVVPFTNLAGGDSVVSTAAGVSTVGKTGYWAITASLYYTDPPTLGVSMHALVYMQDSASALYGQSESVSGGATAVFPLPVAACTAVSWLTAGSQIQVTGVSGEAGAVLLNMESLVTVAFLGGS